MTMFARSSGGAALFIAAGLIAAMCAGCGSDASAPTASNAPSTAASSPTAGLDCGFEVPNQLWGVFEHLPHTGITAVCPADVSADLGAPSVPTTFADVAAAVIGDTTLSIGSEPPGPKGTEFMRVFVGTASSGSGETVVDAFLNGLGTDARNGTLTLGGQVVQHFVLPSGADGFAYAKGEDVAIGYARPLSELHVLDPATVQIPSRDAFTRIILALSGSPITEDTRSESASDTYPLGRGDFTSADDPGWIYFTTEAGQSCGIAPNGTVAGCDNTSADAPEGTNQTVLDDTGATARYAHSDTETFTRDVDVLVAGHRLQNGNAACEVGYQGTVTCSIGEHGFTLASMYGELR